MDKVAIIEVNPQNLLDHSFYCVRDTSSVAFEKKRDWFVKRYEEGLRLKIVKDLNDRAISFIEYGPAEYAWRPVDAPGYMFIQCIMVHSKSDRGLGYASLMIEDCMEDSRQQNGNGVAVMTSKGSWLADNTLFGKNGFLQVDKRDRFELMVCKLDPESPDPVLRDWTLSQEKYRGWHLLYADQCPWHDKSVVDMKAVAAESGIDLRVKKIESAGESQNGPSGYGVFSLLHDGKLLEDHYISATRFKNIIKKELVQ